ncbi:hypothetical protein CRUP_034495 [Coryphaenoides rupestris]|nr:hypothetical protein CRUP_034495 [Coryphaenoides rupestris]
MFSNWFQCDDLIFRHLESQGIEWLHPLCSEIDHKRELKERKRVHNARPGSKDIKLPCGHMHHLINEYRPHQARETLRT